MISQTEFDFCEENRRLRVDTAVTAYWLKDGFYYHGEGIIVQLSRDEVTVQLQENVNWSDDFRAGQLIRVPRISDSLRWSARNCVRLPRKYALAV